MCFHRRLCIVLIAALLSACGIARDIRDEIRAELFHSGPLANQWDPPPPVVSDRRGSTPLAQTALMGVLAAPPADGAETAETTAPEWPKVVITQLRVRMDESVDQVVNPSLLGYPKEGHCIFFDVLLWHDEQRSETVSDLSLCREDLTPEGVHGQYWAWDGMRMCGANTGRERTPGPLPPLTPLPVENLSFDMWLRHDGEYFIHSLLKQLGHTRRANPCHRRFWVVAYELIDWTPGEW